MPRNLKGGNKAKKQGSKNVNARRNREAPFPNAEDNQHIAVVNKILGDCRFNVKILSNNGLKNEEIICWLPASKKKYGRVQLDSYVLMSKREFENKADILYLYNSSDVENLVQYKIIERDIENKETDDIIFTERNDDEIEIDNI